MPVLIRLAFGILIFLHYMLCTISVAAEEVTSHIVSVAVNDVQAKSLYFAVLKRNGVVFVKRSDLERLKIIAKEDATPFLYLGADFMPPQAIEGYRAELKEGDSELHLFCTAKCYPAQQYDARDYVPPEITMKDSGWVLGYFLQANYSSGSLSGSAITDLHKTTGLGHFSSTLLTVFDGSGHRHTLLGTKWKKDFVNSRLSLVVGDAVSNSASWSSPVRFAGVKFGTDFSLQPGFVSFPTLDLDLGAALPSNVEIYINDLRRYQLRVPAGPFEIENLPVMTGYNNINVVVTDITGRQQKFHTALFTDSAMLRSGLNAYSISAGVLRRSYGVRSFDLGAGFLSGTWRHGYLNSITLETHGQFSQSVQVLGGGVSAVLGSVGTLTGAFALSRSGAQLGWLSRWSFNTKHEGWSGNVSFEAAAKKYKDLAFLDRPHPLMRLRTSAAIPIKGVGSLSGSYLWQKNQEQSDIQVYSAFVRLDFFRKLPLMIKAIYTKKPETAFFAGLSFSFSFGGDVRSSVNIDRNRGKFAARAEVYRAAQRGRLGYQAAASLGNFSRYEAKVDAWHAFGRTDLAASKSAGQTALRMTTNGSVILQEGGVYFGDRITQGYAIVKAPNSVDMGVYSNNQRIGGTGKRGYLVVPDLQAFRGNRVELDATSLPIDVSFDTSEFNLVPGHWTGKILKFGLKRSRYMTAVLVDEAGVPLPLGTEIVIGGDSVFQSVLGEAMVGRDGRSFLSYSSVADRIFLKAKIAGKGICIAIVDIEGEAAFSQKAENLICKGVEYVH